MKTIAFGCDHGGFAYKIDVIEHLEKKGYKVIDCGTDSDKSVDYPIFADKVCKEIQAGNADLGILICGTGIGMSMAANKHKGIRAACCENPFSAGVTREHNDANVLCMGARVIGLSVALMMVDQFVTTEFAGDRHVRRVEMVNSFDH